MFPHCSACISPPLFSHKQLSHAAFELSSTMNISFPATSLDVWRSPLAGEPSQSQPDLPRGSLLETFSALKVKP